MSTFEPLTTSKIAAAKTLGKDLWLADSDGKRGFGRLMLRVRRNGAKHFYFRICLRGERKTLALGPYSKDGKANHLTLKQARDAAQSLLSFAAATSSRSKYGMSATVTPSLVGRW